MTELEQFYITGCPRVTERGVGAIVSTNRNGLTSIGLEGLSQTFVGLDSCRRHCAFADGIDQDMSRFSRICKVHRAFRRLTSITLTHINSPIQTWMHDVTELLSTAPLERFQVYATTTISQAHVVTDEFCKAIVTMHGSRLKRFSIHRMKISLDALHDICSRSSVLEELFIFADRHDLVCGLYFICFVT